MLKTNRQIADECAEAAWSWLCERYDIPLPSLQQLLQTENHRNHPAGKPEYRVSMSHRKAFSVPGIPGSSSPQIVISGTSLAWLPNCRTKNTIESWTLQFVGEFTRMLEMERRWLYESSEELTLRATINKIEFARLFFPHLYRADKVTIDQILRKSRKELAGMRSKNESTAADSSPIVVRA
jgi:hypothetical protein